MIKQIIIQLALLLSLFSLSLYCEGRWKVVDSLFIYPPGAIYPYSMKFVGIDCADSNNCVAFGNLKGTEPINRITTDGGKSWVTTMYDSTYFIYDENNNYVGFYMPSKTLDLAYPSKNLCIAICDTGYYWESRDVCKTWIKKKLNTDYKLFGINFYNENHGAIADPRNLFLTSDGGYNWSKVRIPFNDTNNAWCIDDLFFISEPSIYCLIYSGIDTASYIFKTTDFGLNWESNKIPYLRLLRISFLNNKNGWIAGGKQTAPGSPKWTNLILYTSDGGQTWIKQLDTLYGTNYPITRLSFIDNNYGYALTQFYVLWKTTNGGKDWVSDTAVYPGTQVDGNFSDIEPINPNKVFAVNDVASRIYLYEEDSSPVQEQYTPQSNSEINIAPNPLHNEGELKFILDEPALIEVKLYDILGNPLQTIYKGFKEDGINSIKFSAGQYSSGVYYIVINSGSKTYVEKFVKY